LTCSQIVIITLKMIRDKVKTYCMEDALEAKIPALIECEGHSFLSVVGMPVLMGDNCRPLTE